MMISAKQFATLAIAGLAASTSSGASAQSANPAAEALERAAGAAFETNSSHVAQQVNAPSIPNVAPIAAPPIRAAVPNLAPTIPSAPPIPIRAAPITAQPSPITTQAPIARQVASRQVGGTTGFPVQAQPQQFVQAQAFPAQAFQVQYTPEQWLEECYARTGGKRRSRGNGEKGQGIGGVLGAVAGGIAGNRIAGSGERLAGSLIGAGVGGLVGAVAGGLIGRGDRRSRGYDCDAALERHLELVNSGQFRAVQNTASRVIPAQQFAPQVFTQVQSFTQPVMFVQQQVAVPQRAVVREYFTEEFVDVPPPPPAPLPAPRRVKRVPIPIKGR